MFQNYLKIALRNLKKHKGYSFINIAGLAIGMACCILIIVYIVTELSYDKYHQNSDRIYRLTAILTLGGKPNPIASTNFPPTLAMRNDYPEVINSVRFKPQRNVLVKYQDQQFYEQQIFYAEASVFDIFSFPMIEGNPKTALERAYSVVITEDMARKYFGDSNAFGKTLKFNNKVDYTVTGVIKNIPQNSHFVFDMLCSFETFHKQRKEMVESWASPFGCYGYVLLQENCDYKELEKKFPAMVEKYIGDSMKNAGCDVEYFLQPITDIHLHSHLRHEITGNSDITYVYIFGMVALFILLMACINFMNLATARSIQRAKEIGIRKVLGSDRFKIIKQFYGESLFYSFISLLLALVLVQLTLPIFSSLSERDLAASFTAVPWLLPGFLGLAILVGLIAGTYPAFFLSGFKPVNILKGSIGVSGSNFHFRKVLVVIQFTISIALIIGTTVIIRQLDFMKNKNLGFDKEQVVVLPIQERSIVTSLDMVKTELKKYNSILNVAASSHIPGQRPSGGAFVPEGYLDGQSQMMNAISIDQDYLATLGMGVADGRNFSTEFPVDTSESILVNEMAVELIGWKSPLGKTIGYAADPDDKRMRVVGVIKDFHFSSPHRKIAPLFVYHDPGRYRALFIRITPHDISGTLKFIEQKWQEFDPNRPFEYSFLDESFDRQYRNEEKLSRIFSNFTLFAILIACLGLFGLASFSAEQRTKEIGIRKVLGASVSNIVLLLSRDFARWVLLANLLAWPTAYLLMNQWLQRFAYRTDISIWTYLLAAVLALLIAMLTIGFQSARVAVVNPVESLKYE